MRCFQISPVVRKNISMYFNFSVMMQQKLRHQVHVIMQERQLKNTHLGEESVIVLQNVAHMQNI